MSNPMIPICPKYQVPCSLWQDDTCLAENSYNFLLNVWWPMVHTVPFGDDSIAVSKEVHRVICKHVRKYCLKKYRPLPVQHDELYGPKIFVLSPKKG